MFRCPNCGEYELKKAITSGKWVCDNFWCGYEYWEREPLYAPSPFNNEEYGMMPLLDEWKGYKFYFHKGEVITHPYQPHIHVKGNGGHIKVILEPKVKEEENQTYGLREHQINKILNYVSKRKDYFLEKWNEAKRDAGVG